MQVEHQRWWSPRLSRDMEFKVYGHFGEPFLVFPCSRGRYFDFEGLGMVAAIARFIDAGRIKLFTIDSVDGESWYNWDVSPAERNARHEDYEAYIVHEVLPFVRQHCRLPSAQAMATGCSMGASHAVNFFLKHPDACNGTIALSGLCRLDPPELGLSAADLPAVYFNSPLAYLPGLADPWFLERYRRGRIIVCVGQGAWEHEAVEDTRALDHSLRAKAIPAWVDFWGHDVNHDWPWWYAQMNYFLGKLYG
jgi:esterase/lipase superfamily enzyme